ETAQNIVTTALQEATEAAASKLPLKEHLQRNVRYQRAKNNLAPPLPLSRQELHFPDSYANDVNNRRFLQYDSGAGDEMRILIFAKDRQLELLQQHDAWYADGTFKVCPNLFEQVYTIHVSLGTKIIPAVYCL